MIKVLNALLAIVGGVGGAMLLYYVLNKIAERFPNKWEDRIKPWFFAGPAIAAITLYLIYPAIRTIILSFADETSSKFVGLRNYTELLASSDFQQVLINTLLWVAIVPVVTVIFGLIVAVLADRLNPRGEKLTKSIIFLPMAISLVGASTIWKFVYQASPAGQEQIGLLNGIITQFGFDPVAWLQVDTGRLNSLMLMVILVWSQVGFSMVLLSAAIKGVPDDTLEAGRIDGAGERTIFFRIVVPQIWPTVITVFITVMIGTMKIFDIIFVNTGGNFNTDVIGNRFFTELFTNGNSGYAATIVVLLMLAVLPIMIYQVRQFRSQEAAR